MPNDDRAKVILMRSGLTTSEAVKALESVTTPKHYTQGRIEPLAYILANDLGYCEGNIVKYVTRWDKKGAPLLDLMKAQEYLTRLITDYMEKQGDNDGLEK